MRRHLWVLDLALLAGVILAGLVLKDRWSEMSKREQTLLKQVVASTPPPALPAIPKASPVTAASYMDAVQLMLFRERTGIPRS